MSRIVNINVDTFISLIYYAEFYWTNILLSFLENLYFRPSELMHEKLFIILKNQTHIWPKTLFFSKSCVNFWKKNRLWANRGANYSTVMSILYTMYSDVRTVDNGSGVEAAQRSRGRGWEHFLRTLPRLNIVWPIKLCRLPQVLVEVKFVVRREARISEIWLH